MNAREAASEIGKFRCIVAYDGTSYSGFQLQLRQPTVQGELEKAIERVTQGQSRVVAAGRTDAGVHATGQVIHFRSLWPHSPAALERAMNAVLPMTIAVSSLEHAGTGFHARFSAESRSYRYDILNCATRSPVHHRFAVHRSKPLDVAAMHTGLQDLVGTHDFKAFAAGEEPEARTVREITRVECWRSGDMVRIMVEANAFLRHMMRRIAGTAVEIGEGRQTTEHMKRVLTAKCKALAGPTMPAKGLFLVGVSYPDTCDLETTEEDLVK